MTDLRQETLEGPDGPPGIACTEPDASVTRVFHLLGKRWTGLILASLMNGPGHFAELRRAVPGISERMLSDRLTELAALQLVVREVDHGPPLRVAYELTDAGLALRPAMTELTRWAEQHLPGGAESCPNEFKE
ncbi:helix-turn-helix transcriptional regulator [Streptomyces sp. N2-109]|uniref:Helix-turn-helix transcriptional regulator n=1 Tax=Streptomyces gossypii TaxID=2883101 RepID=A0ABT2JML1_9ACTN|nr:helix-turn-helix domain-containing protein [Streptomyces gossypii]MCT2589122.1 helix-turn-helix transcriptional regulator [Streptomyces gossypii]